MPTWVTASELFFRAARSVQPETNATLVVRFLGTLPVIGLDLTRARVFGELETAHGARCAGGRGSGCAPLLRGDLPLFPEHAHRATIGERLFTATGRRPCRVPLPAVVGKPVGFGGA